MTHKDRAEEFIDRVGYKLNRFTIPEIERAFREVAEAEREACAKIADKEYDVWGNNPEQYTLKAAVRHIAEDIRARGES